MPHYKCEPCRARLHVPGAPPELVGHLCPGCGALLDPVDSVAELLGSRAITSRDGDSPATGLDQLMVHLLDPAWSQVGTDAAPGHGRDEPTDWLDDRPDVACAVVALRAPCPR